jgi:2,4-dienoyl-CoA reductase (NADPH2)
MIKETREVIGPECPLGIRILAHEYMEGGYDLEESKIYAQRFEEAGLDFINVAVAPHSATVPQLPLIVPPGAFRYLNKGIKETVNIPIFASVRINDVTLAERILRNEEADFINMCRPILADPELPNKAREGRFEDIVPCIGCIECLGVAYEGGVCCTINPECGREREMKITPAAKKKRVVVIGSGPAGMETARVLKLRGHNVVLYEKEQELGGTFRLASVAPGKQDMALMVDYLSKQVRKLGVEVKCGKEVTAATIDNENADVLIIATGGIPRVPKIPGLEKSNKVISYKDVLMENEVVGQKVVIIGEGGIGCETAAFIAKKSAIDNDAALYLATWGAVSPEQAVSMANKPSKQITMTRRGKVVGEGITPYLRWNTVQSLRRFGIEMITDCEYKEINEKGLVITRDGEEILLEADTIVLAAGWDPNVKLIEQLKNKAPEVYAIGNVKEVKRIFFIMQEASRLARQI